MKGTDIAVYLTIPCMKQYDNFVVGGFLLSQRSVLYYNLIVSNHGVHAAHIFLD